MRADTDVAPPGASDAAFAACLARVRVVLVETSHPGNIGSAARAMKTMGLSHLCLVRPRVFPSAEASALAAGADDVLDGARVVADLDAALTDCHLVFGCTPKARTVAIPEVMPRQAAERALAAAARGEVAIVFGTESSGLSNEHMQRCHFALNIPAYPLYCSLNLAQAVQVVGYELYQHALGRATEAAPALVSGQAVPGAPMSELEGFFAHLEQALGDIDFFKGRPHVTLMRRLRRLFLKASLDSREIMTLRGILSDAQRCAQLAGIVKKG